MTRAVDGGFTAWVLAVTVTGDIVTYAIEALTVIVRSPVGMIVRSPVGLAQDLLRRVRWEFQKPAGLTVDDDHQGRPERAGSLR